MLKIEPTFNFRKVFAAQRDLSICSLLLVAMLIFFISLHLSIGINDLDAFAYIEGARALGRGLGYVDSGGSALNHWPPGYSLILSLFEDPLQASYWINGLSLAIATPTLYLLALQNGWPRFAAIGFAVAFGCGFLHSLAASAKPDILTYAVFLVAAFLIFQDGAWRRTTGLILLSILTPLKLITVVFFPAFFLHDVWTFKPPGLIKRWREYFIAVCAWLAALIFLIVFNLRTLGAMFPSSHEKPTLNALAFELWRFVQEFFRAFMANWYGSIRPPIFFIIFVVVLAAGLVSLATLKRAEVGLDARRTGMVILGLSCILELVRIFYAGPRLMGYGLLLALLGCAPRPTACIRWMAYGAACFGAAVLNAMLVDSSGASHPLYAAMARRIEPYLDPTKPLYTNSLWLVDVHLGRRSTPTKVFPASSDAACFLDVRLPNYDAVGAKVWPIDMEMTTWTLIADVEGAKLYCRP
jgi:hypothetical protein